MQPQRQHQPENIVAFPLSAPIPKQFTPPTLEECKLQGAKMGLPESECEKYFWFYESKDWHVGKSRMQRWVAAMAGWKLRWQERQAPVRQVSVWEINQRIEAKHKLISNLRVNGRAVENWKHVGERHTGALLESARVQIEKLRGEIAQLEEQKARL